MDGSVQLVMTKNISMEVQYICLMPTMQYSTKRLLDMYKNCIELQGLTKEIVPEKDISKWPITFKLSERD